MTEGRDMSAASQSAPERFVDAEFDHFHKNVHRGMSWLISLHQLCPFAFLMSLD